MKTKKHLARQFELIPEPFNLAGEMIQKPEPPPEPTKHIAEEVGQLFPDFAPFREGFLRYK